jgi:hypothetical protein
MRITYAVALGLTIIMAVGAWFQRTNYLCPVPITYALGQLDESFALSEADALGAIADAADVWETAANEDLFVAVPDARDADIVVNFVFDDRQATANDREATAADLDTIASENEALRAQIETLIEQYDAAAAELAADQARYDADLAAYNAEVQRYNDQGGASAAVFERLESERLALRTELRALRQQTSDLNAAGARVNALNERANEQIVAYNADVRNFNSRYNHGEEFTQGDYTGDAISIYKFSDRTELVQVLAHEFGHGLGIDHVDTEGALMYYLLNDELSETASVALTSSDQAALAEVCQFHSFAHEARSIIRTIFN